MASSGAMERSSSGVAGGGFNDFIGGSLSPMSTVCLFKHPLHSIRKDVSSKALFVTGLECQCVLSRKNLIKISLFSQQLGMFKEGCTFRQLCSFRGCYLFGFLGKLVVFFPNFFWDLVLTMSIFYQKQISFKIFHFRNSYPCLKKAALPSTLQFQRLSLLLLS